MNTPQSRCDDAQLIALINDRLSGEDMESMLSHVEECDRCRLRMDDLSADNRHWQRTIQALSDGPSDALHCQASSQASLFLVPCASLLSPEPSFKPYGSEQIAKQLLSAPSHPEMLGRLGRYEVERLVGSGGMGVVFKAFDTELNRPVAIKVLAPHLASCGSARQRFAREARAAAAVISEHVVPIHNVETERETTFLVMKFIDGESLQARLDREGPLAVDEILRIGLQVTAGLAAAHQQGLVHRDIKPANILLEQGLERALITDFGLARAVDDAQQTQSGFCAGTPQYMSPEQVSGHAVDCSSDLFSLGSVIYAMCTGRPPFRAENSFGIFKRIAEDTPRSIREINPRIPLWLECIVNRLLAKSPSHRLQSATEASQLFAQCLQHVQNASSTPLPNTVSNWMSEAAASRVQSAGLGIVAKDGRLALANRRRFLAVASGLLAVGVLAIFSPLSSKDRLSENGQATNSLIFETAPSQFNLAKPASTSEMSPAQAFDPELEWDGALRTSRSLQQEFDSLEKRLMRDLSP